MSNVPITVAHGDGIGPEIMAATLHILKEAGARLEHICKVTIYLTDPRFREPVYRTIGRWLKGVYPVSTGIVVAGRTVTVLPTTAATSPPSS